MEKGNLSLSLISFFFVLTCVGSLYYFDKVDRAAVESEAAKVKLQQSTVLLDAKRRFLAERTSRAAKKKLAISKIEAAEARIEKAQKVNAAAEGRRNVFEAQLRSLVADVRKRATDNLTHLFETDIPEVCLTGGRVLNCFRLRKKDGSKCYYTYLGGLGVVDDSELPASLRTFLDIGPEGITAQLRKWQVELGQVPAHTAETVPDTGVLSIIQKRIAGVEVRIAAATAHKDRLEEEVRALGQKVILEAGRSRQTFNLRTLLDVAEGNVGMARNELAKLEAELKKLRIEEEKLLSEIR